MNSIYCRTPCIKDITILSISSTCWSSSIITRECSIFYIWIQFQYISITIYPSYCIFSKRFCISGYINLILSYRWYCRTPSWKWIFILSIWLFSWSSSIITRKCSIRDIFISLQYRTILVCPCYCIFISIRSICCSICNISLYRSNFRCPSFKYISMFSIWLFSWSYSTITRNRSIRDICMYF